jgi:hypothetical protein
MTNNVFFGCDLFCGWFDCRIEIECQVCDNFDWFFHVLIDIILF